MKAAAFDFVRATTLDDVYATFERYGGDARILAGGQSLMPVMNMRLAAPRVLVDINHVAALDGISLAGDRLRIGALSRHRDLSASTLVAQHAPLLALAAPHIAHPAIRNRGTLGGSLCHADPAAELPACAIACDARINAAGRHGERIIKAADFFLGVFETALEPGEILVSLDIPVVGATERVAFAELARRQGDYALVGLAAKGVVDGQILRNLRLVFFSVADRPLIATQTMAALEGKQYSREALKTALGALESDLDDLTGDLHASAATKNHLARVLFRRVLPQLMESGKE
jgi:carbon-monoxide dehydrogenase medium subunit